jgi:hypothetical protein
VKNTFGILMEISLDLVSLININGKILNNKQQIESSFISKRSYTMIKRDLTEIQ